MIATPGSELEIAPFVGNTNNETALLRFTTAGSVDDGKSTLIGRLLYDTKTVYEDQLASIAKSGINRSDGPLDLSLITDGLRTEREQGITIDVAYRYFSTPRRRFILADTPGHEQYTRNMVTGASTAHAAIVLIDAGKGLLAQSRRHTYIASLLGIQHVIVAVNKMDLVDYREEVFVTIARDFEKLASRLRVPQIYITPVSALKGDNVVTPSRQMPWYAGPTLLEYLESIPVEVREDAGPLRLPVQYVIRPDSRFRGFAGRVASGTVRQGSAVIALPSGIRSRIKSITTFDGELDEAGSGSSIAITLEDEIDLGRGDLLAGLGDLPESSNELVANLVWMSPGPSRQREFYLLKQASRTVRARIQEILYRVDINTLDHKPASELQMNDIARVNIETTLPLFFDPYRRNRTTGSFILIDPITNATVAGGMIEGAADICESEPERKRSRETEIDRESMGAAIWLTGRQSVAERLARVAQDEGYRVEVLSGVEFTPVQLTAVARVLKRMGVTPILHVAHEDAEFKTAVISIFGEKAVFHRDLPPDDNAAIANAFQWLRRFYGQESS
jgi:bifunctional enzyme CysN/CysC/sulfate adenylyltransferase subunit 1